VSSDGTSYCDYHSVYRSGPASDRDRSHRAVTSPATRVPLGRPAPAELASYSVAEVLFDKRPGRTRFMRRGRHTENHRGHENRRADGGEFFCTSGRYRVGSQAHRIQGVVARAPLLKLRTTGATYQCVNRSIALGTLQVAARRDAVTHAFRHQSRRLSTSPTSHNGAGRKPRTTPTT
jgi:hypothetical protein